MRKLAEVARFTPDVAAKHNLTAEDHIAFAVEVLEQACRDAQTSGLKYEAPPCTYPCGESAKWRDPDRRLVELHDRPHDR